MSRTTAHIPTRVRMQRGLPLNADNTANYPTDGRVSMLRAVTRGEGSRLRSRTAKARRAMLKDIRDIRTIEDAVDMFGDGWHMADPCIMGDVSGRRVGFRIRWDSEPPRYATYDHVQDDIAQAEWEAEQDALRAESEYFSHDYYGAYDDPYDCDRGYDTDWMDTSRTPHSITCPQCGHSITMSGRPLE
jgi:hypothetical protein